MGFLFSSTSSIATPETKLGNIDNDRVATNEEARALPWFAGRARLGVTWMTDALDKKADPVTQTYQAGKKKKKAVTGYIYSARLAGLVSHGLVDALHEVWIDSVKAWDAGLSRDLMPAGLIDITGQASIRFYWGEQSDPDETLPDHPAYLGQCYAVFQPLVFGQDRTSAPSVEFVMSRRTAVPGMSNPTNEGDVCPIHALLELLCHPRYGIGLRLGDFDLVAAQAFSDAVTAAGIWVSPVVTRATSALQVAADILGYFDGFIRQDATGRYTFGSASLPVDYEDAPVLDSAQLTEHPEVRSESYALTPSEVRLTYTDRARDMKESVAVFSDTASLSIHGTATPLQLQRPAVTRQAIAQAMVTTAGLRAALPNVTVTARALFSAAAGILPGDGVLVRPWHGAAYLLKCRLARKDLARSTDCEVGLTLMLDPAELAAGDAAESYVPPAPETAEPEDLVEPLLRTLPAELAEPTAGDVAVLFIGARSNSLTTGYDVHFSRDDASYELLVGVERFAATGVLVDAWPLLGDFAPDDATDLITLAGHGLVDGDLIGFAAGAGTLPAPLVEGAAYYVRDATTDTFALATSPGGAALDLTDVGVAGLGRGFSRLIVQIDLDMHPVDRLAFTSQTSDQADEGRLLLFIGSEILAVEGYVAMGGNVMRLAGLRRARFGSMLAGYADGERAWLLYRADVASLTHESFTAGVTRYFKAVTQTAVASQDIAEVDPLSLVL